jgi:DNA mismatch repair ATPase MutS
MIRRSNCGSRAQVATAAAELDALLSLAHAALLAPDGGAMCRPTVMAAHPAGRQGAPFLRARALRHVNDIQLSQAGAFVPNDVDLGVADAPFMLLTGPNTGGKSTLMRQVRALLPPTGTRREPRTSLHCLQLVDGVSLRCHKRPSL